MLYCTVCVFVLKGSTMAGDAGRIRKELAECAKDSNSGVTATPKGDSLAHLEGTILGPQGTPFEGGTFQINIDIPSGYPFEPPKMKFVTKIWHPNISSQTGAICLVSRERKTETER